MRVLAALGIPAVVALALYALAVDGDGGEVFAVGLLTATASFAAGALIGFLFGIPRSAAKAKAAEAGAATEGEKTAAEAQHFLPNTNLEEISDWLTKILVGVGLIQIHQVSGAVDTLASGLQADLGGGSQGYAVAVTLLVAFSVTGFVSGYLFTRLRLQTAFEQALTLKQVREEVQAGSNAMALVEQQLSPGEIDRPPLAALTEALKAATAGVRSQAFFRARDQRRKNWRGPGKEYVAPTIPIFEALIACDPEEHYHRTRAELAYALKDQEVADLARAKATLDKAIQMRPETDLDWTRMYELNRAYCSILLDPLKGTQTPSTEDVASPIVADLVVAAGSADIREKLRGGGAENAPIKAWLERNKKRPDVQALLIALSKK
jgi:hypothetical protein